MLSRVSPEGFNGPGVQTDFAKVASFAFAIPSAGMLRDLMLRCDPIDLAKSYNRSRTGHSELAFADGGLSLTPCQRRPIFRGSAFSQTQHERA